MNPFFKSMPGPKKRAVDPNAPPRPNLLSHEKTIKETRVTLEELQSENRQLRARIDALESKMTSQTQYLQALHNTVTARSRG